MSDFLDLLAYTFALGLLALLVSNVVSVLQGRPRPRLDGQHRLREDRSGSAPERRSKGT